VGWPPAAVLAAGASAGLIPAARCVALLAGLRGGKLIPRPSFFQLDNIRKARRRGEPWHLIVHEDVLIFRGPLNSAVQGQQTTFSATGTAPRVRFQRDPTAWPYEGRAACRHRRPADAPAGPGQPGRPLPAASVPCSPTR
jgi:hypothetical protein